MKFNIRDERQMRAMSGMTSEQFDRLLEAFEATYERIRQEEYEAGLKSGERSRKPGGGRKGGLPTLRDKLFFVLYYYKSYRPSMCWGRSSICLAPRPTRIYIG